LMALEIELRSIPTSTLLLSQKRTRRLLGIGSELCSVLIDIIITPGTDLEQIQALIRNVGVDSGVEWFSVRQMGDGRIRALCRYKPDRCDFESLQSMINVLEHVESCQLLR
jgi:hypothetical protein